MIIRAQHDVVASYKTAIKNGRTWEEISENDPFEKKALNIRLDKRLYKMTKTKIDLSTLNKNFRISCTWTLYDKITEMFQKYPTCDPLIFERDGNFYLSISFETPDIEIEGTKILGIDVGEKRFVVTSNGLCLAGRDLAQQKRRIRYIRKMLGKKKDSHSDRTKLKTLKRKETNVTKHHVHQIANEILKCSEDVIVMEDLDGIKDKKQWKARNRKRNQYPWRMLRDYLTYKALFVNRRVATVNPYNTSKDDYRGISSGERKGCRYYASDGKVYDADWNASINVGNRYSSISGLPLSFVEPRDGKLDFRGRLNQEPIVNGIPLEEACGKLRDFSPCSN